MRLTVPVDRKSFFRIHDTIQGALSLNKEEKKYIRMTETPVWKLVLKLAVPTTISMMITTIYNTADTFFVSKISVTASAATGIVFSLMAILQAFGFMLGHGAGANISRLLGARDIGRASTFLSTSFFLAVLIGSVIGIFGLIFLEPFMYLLGSTPSVLADAKAYALFILLAGPAMTVSCVLNNVLRYEGIAVYAMVGLTFGGILNIILDPVFIFVLGLGTAGAGLATAVSQYLGVFVLISPFLRGKTSTRISLRSFTRDPHDVSNIFLTGLPSMVRQGANSIATALLNSQAAVYGDAAIAAFSIVNRCTGLLFSLALGLGQGFQPVSAFNYGAKKYSRVKKAYIFTILSATAVLAVICTLCKIHADSIVMLFRKDEDVIRIGTEALGYSCIGLVFLPLSSIGSMLFQSIGKKGRAFLLSFIQSGGFFIPMLLILPRFFGLTGLELAHPAAYCLAGIVSLPIVIHYLSRMGREDSPEQG